MTMVHREKRNTKYLCNKVLVEHVIKRLKENNILSQKLYDIIIKS